MYISYFRHNTCSTTRQQDLKPEASHVDPPSPKPTMTKPEASRVDPPSPKTTPPSPAGKKQAPSPARHVVHVMTEIEGEGYVTELVAYDDLPKFLQARVSSTFADPMKYDYCEADREDKSAVVHVDDFTDEQNALYEKFATESKKKQLRHSFSNIKLSFLVLDP